MKKNDDNLKPAINSGVSLHKEILPSNSPVSEINRSKLNSTRLIIGDILVDCALVEWTTILPNTSNTFNE